MSMIERALSLRPLKQDKNILTSINLPWNPPWGRGLYGGSIIAQCLVAAAATVSSSFDAHSFHGHFLLPAQAGEQLVYHVHTMLDGNTFMRRKVQAKQGGKCIFEATISFTRATKARKLIGHAHRMPERMTQHLQLLDDTHNLSASTQTGETRPCDFIRCRGDPKSPPQERKLQQWMRARGPLSSVPLHEADASLPSEGTDCSKNYHTHAAALAYMTDNYFIGTAVRVHNASRFTDQPIVDRALARFQGGQEEAAQQRYFAALAREEALENKDTIENGKLVKMMVSLDHTIYFHNPRGFSADAWMLAEMNSPWAGHERGLVVQRIWSQEGLLIATCIQEGIIRLEQNVRTSRI